MISQREHCFYCFETLENKVNGTKYHKAHDFLVSQGNDQKYPLFVTWTKNGNLRGCIGCFNDLDLLDGLKDYAIIAGTKDHRFPPIKSDEIPKLECEVSLLHSFESCSDINDWTIGTHGLRFHYDGHSSTFLPEVAEEWHWTKEQTLQELAKKSGMHKKITPADYPKIKLERYQSSHIQVKYADYQAYENQ